MILADTNQNDLYCHDSTALYFSQLEAFTKHDHPGSPH